MIFAGMDGGLPCTVGKYVNFDGTQGIKNFISFGGQSASCPLQQFEVRALGEHGTYFSVFDDTDQPNTGIFEIYYRKENALMQLTSGYFSVGSSKTNRSFLEFDGYAGFFRKIHSYGSGYTSMEHTFQGVFGTYIVSGGAHGGCVLRPNEGSFYGYTSSNGTNFALLDGSFGSISAGVDTSYGGLGSSGSAFAQMGQLNNGYFGFYVQSYYNQLSWVLNPFADQVNFYLANNGQNNRLSFTASSFEASIWAYNSNGNNFLWDGSGSGTLNLYTSTNSLQFYPSQGSFWGFNSGTGNSIKFNMMTGLFQLWNTSARYIDLNLYMLESGTTATFHYVYKGRDKNGNLIYLKDANGRNVKVLSTGPIILSDTNTTALCAINYGA